MNSGRFAWFSMLVVGLCGLAAAGAQVVEKKKEMNKGGAPPVPAVVPPPPLIMKGVTAPTSPVRVTTRSVSAAAPAIPSDFADELTLKSAGLGTGGPALLDFFR